MHVINMKQEVECDNDDLRVKVQDAVSTIHAAMFPLAPPSVRPATELVS